ncbi:vomeronasal type-2 receptor 26-like [Sceloporus undulatus]|uniref:vomeronasal type-2 receptor 26-like n=1 Tax=Sceloporus undulatus TaxID=8520 RepID=UPI001C4D055E|nr:vomeronasal type-2 receptor 26-like [Sceloporus undulatus]
MATNEDPQYMGIINLLKHFGCTWVGFFVVDDESGEHFVETLEPLLSRNGICPAFTRQIPSQDHFLDSKVHTIFQIFKSSEIRIIILYSKSFTIMTAWYHITLRVLEEKTNAPVGKMWITAAQSDFVLASINQDGNLQMFQGALSFMIHSSEVPGFQEFLQTIKPDWKEADDFLKEFWQEAFHCLVPDVRMPYMMSGTCTGEERLESLIGPFFEMRMSGYSYSIYNAIYAVAHALHALYLSRSYHRSMAAIKRGDLQDLQPWQLHPFLQAISFNNSAEERVSFNANREVRAGFDVMNMVTFPNNSFVKMKVGWVDPNAPDGKELTIHEDMITWHSSFKQVRPLSVCSDPCPLGYQKRKKEGEKFCCFDCVPCPEGKISNQTDMADCFQCPDDQYPSTDQDQCIPKLIVFLSFKSPLGKAFASSAASFSMITVLVLGVFIKHKDTPIVKANNRELSYTLLLSLIFCFLSSLLFLGRPGKLTCLLQQPISGTTFSLAVSCVLAKTITVVLAFMATGPGSSMRKWVAITIMLSCSLIQVGICTVWLGTFPPFPDLDMNSVPGQIVAQCNKGFPIMFYLIQAYITLLSTISFIVAFLARKLPDTFNEAKLITFSMLIFCSVWLSFVPTYLSTKGTDIVAVEIFSILASSAGLLCFIFPWKCYIILLKPELNSREQLSRRKV